MYNEYKYKLYIYNMLMRIFARLWKKEMINSKEKNQRPSFLRTLIKMFGAKFVCTGILLTILEICFR